MLLKSSVGKKKTCTECVQFLSTLYVLGVAQTRKQPIRSTRNTVDPCLILATVNDQSFALPAIQRSISCLTMFMNWAVGDVERWNTQLLYSFQLIHDVKMTEFNTFFGPCPTLCRKDPNFRLTLLQYPA